VSGGARARGRVEGLTRRPRGRERLRRAAATGSSHPMTANQPVAIGWASRWRHARLPNRRTPTQLLLVIFARRWLGVDGAIIGDGSPLAGVDGRRPRTLGSTRKNTSSIGLRHYLGHLRSLTCCWLCGRPIRNYHVRLGHCWRPNMQSPEEINV
jgi:hypothetical protein